MRDVFEGDLAAVVDDLKPTDPLAERLRAIAAETEAAAEPPAELAAGEPPKPTPDAVAAEDKLRIDRIKKLGEAAGAPPLMIRHVVARGFSVDDAFAAFEMVARDGQWADKNAATFYRVKQAARKEPRPA